jgi:hypothetical protein
LAGIAGWCVTSTTGGSHADKSLHYVKATNGKGRAVDLASRTGPGDVAGLLAINEQIIQLIPLSMISELIFAGGVCVKNGRIVDGTKVFGATVMAAHNNHNHLAVIEGFTYNGSQEVAVPDNNPDLPDIVGPVQFAIAGADQNGICQGYYIFSHATGELHSFGPGAKFYGRSEVTKLVTMGS